MPTPPSQAIADLIATAAPRLRASTGLFGRVVMGALFVALLAPLAMAEKADRNKPMAIEADKQGSWDVQRQVLTFAGNVLISQGSMAIRAERMEVRDQPNGQRTVAALGSAARPASFRQRRDGPGDEWVEGSADRIDLDTRTDTLRFSGNAAVRRLRGSVVTDEVTGGAITWDNKDELFNVTGGKATAANPGGRVRFVLTPRGDESGASAPTAAPASTAPAAPLKPARALGDKP